MSEYRKLSKIDKDSMDALTSSLLQAAEFRKTKRPHLIRLPSTVQPLAAGLGFTDESLVEADSVYLHESEPTLGTNDVFHVNGNSMEPTLHNRKYSVYQRISDGFHSHNLKYPTMLFSDDDEIRLIGKVNEIISQEEFATEDEIRVFEQLDPD